MSTTSVLIVLLLAISGLPLHSAFVQNIFHSSVACQAKSVTPRRDLYGASRVHASSVEIVRGALSGPQREAPGDTRGHSLDYVIKGVCVSLFCFNLLFSPSAAHAKEDLQPQSYYQQLRDAMPLKTMRGIWKYKEVKDGKVCDGTLTFRGQLDNPNRGDVTFDGGNDSCYTPIPPVRSIKGKWLMKPARFERTTIQFNARWKVKSEQGTFIYRGDVSADASLQGMGGKNLPDATMKGEILRDFGKEDFRKVGTFFASLRDKLPQEVNEPQEVATEVQ